MIKTKRKNTYEIEIPKQGSMLIDATVYASDRINLEPTAIKQLADGAAIPSVRRALATPDIHQGYGVPIGSVLGMEEVVVPAAVGFDINCGMRVLRTSLNAEDVDLKTLASSIRRDIPLGEGKSNVRLGSDDLDRVLARGVQGLLDVKHTGHRVWDSWDASSESIDLNRIEDNGSMKGKPAAVSPHAKQRGKDQLATLGGGNHFVEFQIVDKVRDKKIAKRFGLFQGQLLVMIHSGSRGLGHQVGSEYMKQAQKQHGSEGAVPFLPLDSKSGEAYVGAMQSAANYAFANRHLMGVLVKGNILHHHPDAKVNLVYDVPHNIAKFEKHSGKMLLVHRKGATRSFGPGRMRGTSFADTGQPVLIPGSMGTASYILSGVDDIESTLASVNHGAGRVMSRTEARDKFRGGKMVRKPAISDREFAEAMEGVLLICESKRGIREEAPQAYKDIDLVMDTVLGAGLANDVVRTRPLAVLKG